MALNTHWQKEDGSLGGQPERNKVYRNKAWTAYLTLIIAEREREKKKEVHAAAWNGLFHFNLATRSSEAYIMSGVQATNLAGGLQSRGKRRCIV